MGTASLRVKKLVKRNWHGVWKVSGLVRMKRIVFLFCLRLSHGKFCTDKWPNLQAYVMCDRLDNLKTDTLQDKTIFWWGINFYSVWFFADLSMRQIDLQQQHWRPKFFGIVISFLWVANYMNLSCLTVSSVKLALTRRKQLFFFSKCAPTKHLAVSGAEA